MDDLVKFFSQMVRGEKDRNLIALEVFDNLKPKDYCSVPIYNILIGALRKIGEVKKALTFFQKLKESKMEPDSCTNSNTISCCVEIGDIHEACSGYNEIKEMSSIPSVDAYVSLVKGLCKVGEINDAFMVVRDGLANVESWPWEFKYILRIIHIGRTNDGNKVMDVISEMVKDDCSVDDVIFYADIAGMCQYGTIEEGRKVFSSMRECKMLMKADSVVYDDLLIDHMKKKTVDLVLSGLKFFRLESKLKATGSNHLTFLTWKGLVRFGKRGKLSPRFIGPSDILERIGPVAYKSKLPQDLSAIHDIVLCVESQEMSNRRIIDFTVGRSPS